MIVGLLGALFVSGFFAGRHYVKVQWDAYKSEMEALVLKEREKAAQASAKTIVKYVEKIKVIHEKREELNHENLPDTVLPGSVRLFHDAGVSLSTSARYTDDSPVTVKALASGVLSNYETCAENSERLKALQDWLRETRE